MKEPLGKYQLSVNRTDRLRDSNATTCLSMFTTPEVNSVQLKIVVNRDDLFKRIFRLYVTTNRWSTCSPIEGVNGFIYSMNHFLPCVALNENSRGGTRRCEFRCDGRYGLDFILLEVKRLTGRNNDMMQVCEVETI